MKRYYLHGTSMENARKIMKEGFDEIPNRTWQLSENYGYIRSIEFYDEMNYSVDPDTVKNWGNKKIIKENILQCIQSAQITAAIQNSKETSIGLILLEIDDEHEGLMEDTSSENALKSDYQISAEDFNKFKVEMFEIKKAYRPDCRFIYLHNLPLLNVRDMDDEDYELMNIFEDCDIYDVECKLIFDKCYNIDALESYIIDHN